VTPDLRAYEILLVALTSRRLSPSEFQGVFVPLFKGDQLSRPPDIYDLLNEVFLAAEEYYEDTTGVSEYAVSEEQLYEIVERVLKRLKVIAAAG
jgi:hypothetical protein